MPPYKVGLLKRKVNIEYNKENNKSVESKSTEERSDASESDAEFDLMAGELEDDEADSDGEPTEDQSDTERDEVIFGEDEDSTFGDDIDDSEGSSDVTDSEADNSDDSESEGSGDSDDEQQESALSDSGEESGIGQTHSSDTDTPQDVDKTSKSKKLSKENLNSKAKPKKKFSKVKETNLSKNENEASSAVDKLQKEIEDVSVIRGKDEYESGDTSDEEERVNTTGEVPRWWYDEYPHVGYDLDGRRIMRPAQRDHIDDFLKRCEDPDFWRTVKDPATGQDIVLSTEDLELIAKIRAGNLVTSDEEEYKPWVEWFSREVLATPVRGFPDHKRSFLPSRGEAKAVARIVHALKMGWTKTRKEIAREQRRKKERVFYDLWGAPSPEHVTSRRLTAPRRPPPSHAESYNPPPEFLLDQKEMKEWDSLATTPWKRKYTFLPNIHTSLRAVPAYPRYVRERFLRCLDLYLAPRAIKMRLTISASDLVPSLPSPRDLQPFPTCEVLTFRGHGDLVRSCDFDPSGQYVVSASEDGTVKVWETSSGRCLRTITLGDSVTTVAWCPAKGLSLVAVAAGSRVLLLNPGEDIGAHRAAVQTDQLLEEPPPQHDHVVEARVAAAVRWEQPSAELWARGVRVVVQHLHTVNCVAWQARGDYLASSTGEQAARAVMVHQVSRRRSTVPFRRALGTVTNVGFHPTRPVLCVQTQRAIRMYDLVKQTLVKKLQPAAQWLSDFAIHPAGDNLLAASYDRKCIWFDLDLSSRPYQTLRVHSAAVRSVTFHRRYPLFASGGDDDHLVVYHGMVYNDLLQNPLLVPLRTLPAPRAPTRAAPLRVLCVRFHPTQPWLLASMADGTLRMYA